jgi:hypothetical protein
MKRFFHIRSLIRMSVCVATSLAAPASFAAPPDRQQAQAQVLDHAEYLCANCFFGTSDYYYCFAADNRVLIGYQKTRVLSWRDESKNYLTKVHKAWTVWTAPGQTVPISYDDKHIWVNREGGKQVRLIQDYSHDIFSTNDQCRAAVKAKSQ